MLHEFSTTDKISAIDILRITNKGDRVKAEVNLFKFRDKDTRQIICYIPSLDITGYGATEEKAMEMVQFSLNDLFLLLETMSSKDREAELIKLGFIHSQIKNKEFSKAYVDFSGTLQNFNAVNDHIERVRLVS